MSFLKIAGMTDPMHRPFDSLSISPFNIIQDVSSLMSPTPLDGYMTIDQMDCGQKSLASIDKKQLQAMAVQSAPIEII